jgi:transposase
MLNVRSVEKVYLACGSTDLRKSIDGLSMIVQETFKLDPYEEALFIFCNKAKDKLKILHFDHGFWLYYYRLEHGKFKWPEKGEKPMQTTLDEIGWLLKGYEVRKERKFKEVTERIMY